MYTLKIMFVRLSPPAYRFRYFYRTEASHRIPVSVKKIAETHCMTLFSPLLPSLTVNLPEAVGRKLVPVGGFFGTGFGKKATWHHACAWKSKFQHSPAIAHMQINFPDFFLPSSPGGSAFLVPVSFKNTETETGIPVVTALTIERSFPRFP